MRKILYILGILSVLTSCSFLDVQPSDIYRTDNFYTTEKDIVSALNGVYAPMTESALYGQMISGRMGLQGDLGYNNNSVDVNTVAENMATTSDAKIRGYWLTCYKGISNANLLIANINNADDISEENRLTVLGEARFLRAYYYFLLVSKFGGVPLRTEPVEGGDADNLQIARSTSKEIYDFIISEMEFAAGAVRDISEVTSPGVVSKSAVWGILARVCLYNAGYPNYADGMYEKARKYAKKVIHSGKHSLNPDYRQVFINYMQDVYDFNESIWEVEFYGNDKTAYNSVAGSIGRCTGPRNKNLNTTIGYCLGTVRTNQYHYSLYDETDVRRDWNIAGFYYDSETDALAVELPNVWSRYAGKFRREYEVVQPSVNDVGPGNFPLLRYADVLLMFAEAYAADLYADPADEVFAYECFNRVRRRAHAMDQYQHDGTVDFPMTSNKSAFLEEIQNERARELAFEMLRKDDLVRWGIFYQRMKSSEMMPPTSISEGLFNYCSRCINNVEPKDVLWPIPSSEMNVNAKLIQNEGW